MASEGSHPPTKRRLAQARRDGKVLKSQGLTQFLTAVGSVLVLWPLLLDFPWVANQILLECGQIPTVLGGCLSGLGKWVVVIVGGTLGAAGAVCILAEGLRNGFHINAALLSPKLERLNLGSGLKSALGGLKAFWPRALASLVLILWFSILGRQAACQIGFLLGVEAAAAQDFFQVWLGRALAGAVVVLGLAAWLDYQVQRLQFLKGLRMTRADRERENREQEGDPLQRGMRRRCHEEILEQDIASRVRQARVIIVGRQPS